MKSKKIVIGKNLAYLRQNSRLSIEAVANKIGVSRQAVAKWETGETVPDIINCDKLAELYQVSVDDLLHYDADEEKLGIPPKGKYMFGITKLGERGQVVIPKQARDKMRLKAGDTFVVLGDDNPGTRGIALVPAEQFEQAARAMLNSINVGIFQEDTGEE
ncbi:helix-turn-helix domain-containing protein [Konateibacter massiliensis]|uniref:helix-turn-helix domain-containing protein n=1 Tax=Konateibacter massiliensis TaxID=2002841 RepID=UPI002E254F0D